MIPFIGEDHSAEHERMAEDHYMELAQYAHDQEELLQELREKATKTGLGQYLYDSPDELLGADGRRGILIEEDIYGETSISINFEARACGKRVFGTLASWDMDELMCQSQITTDKIVQRALDLFSRTDEEINEDILHDEAEVFEPQARRGLAGPSVRQKVDCHLKAVSDVCKILPITEIIVETASFDIQKIKNPNINGAEYQQGEQLGFWNTREYVLFRDNHTCQYCKGKSKDPVLNVHHIESRKTGGNAPNNLITLCNTCHKGYHRGVVKMPEKIRRGMKFSDAAFMGIMRWAFYEKLKQQYPNVHMTFGYLTKNTRITNGLPKAHCIDARCISGHPLAEPPAEMFYQKKVRCHNRYLHKCTIEKGGVRKRNQAPYLVKGYRLFDKVTFHGKECFIFARRSSGSFDVRTLDGTKISPCAGYKKLRFLEPRRTILTERKTASPPEAALEASLEEPFPAYGRTEPLLYMERFSARCIST